MSMNRRIQKFGKSAEPIAGKIPSESEEARAKLFPLHCLPPAAAAMGQAICKAERVPESLVGCCLLGRLSASVGAGLQVRSGPNRVTRANLYIVASGESGSGKSETDRHTAQPFRDFEDELIAKWEWDEWPALMAEKELLESEIAGLKKKKFNSPTEREEIRAELERRRRALLQIESQLQAPVLSVEDITSQALAVRLAARGECLASFSADAGEVINNLLGRYNKLDRTDDGLYVKAWTGDRFQQDRIGRPPVSLRRPCLSALWLVQRDKVETILSERSLTEGGTIPRLLLCHTNCQPRYIQDGVEAIPTGIAKAYGKVIRELLETFRLASEPVTIEHSPEALRAFNDHYNAIVARWHNGEIRDVTSYALRWTEQAWRIAVCIHGGTWGKRAGEQSLALETSQAAITIADWFSVQQLDILAAGRQAFKDAKRASILDLLVDCPKGISGRDVQRALHLATAEEARLLMEEMETEGVLQSAEVPTGGRPQRVFSKARK